MVDAVITVGQQKGKENFRLFVQAEDQKSDDEQLNKLYTRYTCKILVEDMIKRPGQNYHKISSSDSKEYSIHKTNLQLEILSMISS